MSKGTNIVLQHIPGKKLQSETIELRDDLTAEGNIQAERVVRRPYLANVEPTRLTNDERAAIDAFIAAKGVRRFPPNDCGHDFWLCAFLRERGYKVQRNCGDGGRRRAPFFIDDKAYDHAAMVAFVNRIRADEGMMQLGTAA